VLVIAGDAGTIGGIEGDTLAQVAIGVAMLLFVGGAALVDYRGRLGEAARHFTIWVGIGFVLVLGYSYRDTFQAAANRVTGELVPGYNAGVPTGDADERSVRLRKAQDGQFLARMDVNGAAVTMLVDTGASTVVLRPADAKSAGIDIDRLTYSVPVRTANGQAFAAPARIRRLAIGGIVMENVDALVAKPGALGQSLLGMTFLTRLRSYEVMGDFLTLRG
jgi:aspartyl protease family protein